MRLGDMGGKQEGGEKRTLLSVIELVELSH